MDVTDVLRDRMQAPSGFQNMVTLSVAAHVVLGVAIVLAPKGWMSHRADTTPSQVMTISLSGAGEGPVSGGMTAIGGKAIQAVKPPEEPKRREPDRAPAAKTPEMTLPLPNAKPAKAAARTPVTQAPDDAKGRVPTRGKEQQAGSANSLTGNRGMGFGLSTGGGPGTGSSLDVADFCCPEYIGLMVQRIRSVWQQNQAARGECIVRFTIQRDGRLTDTAVERSSGNEVLDLAALRAVYAVRSLTPLPAQFPNPTLTVHLNFQYQ